MGCDLLCLLFFLPDFMPALTAVVAASCRSCAFPPPVRKLLYTCKANRKNQLPTHLDAQLSRLASPALRWGPCSATNYARPLEHCLRHHRLHGILS